MGDYRRREGDNQGIERLQIGTGKRGARTANASYKYQSGAKGGER